MSCPVCGERPSKCWCDEDDLKSGANRLREENDDLLARAEAAEALADRLGGR